MSERRARAGRLAMVGALVAMVAALVAPRIGNVTAGTGDAEPVDTSIPADASSVPETTEVETEPTASTEVAATQPVEPPAPESAVDESSSESTVVDTTPASTAVESPVVETVGSSATVSSASEPDTESSTTTEPAGVIALAEPGDVTVVAVCDPGFRPTIHITNLGSDDVRVSVGRASVDLAPSDEVHMEWPTLDGDPPPFDPAPKWDAVDLAADVVFDSGALSLPAGCPPDDVPTAPLDLSSVAGDGSVALSWAVPASDGGSPIADYTVEHNVYPIEDDGWTLVDDGVGTGTSFEVTGLTNGETYLFRIRAVNAVGPGVATEAKDTPNVVPTPPGSIAVAPTLVRGQLRLSWIAPTEGFHIFTYGIERSLDGVDWALLTEVGGDTTSYLDSGLSRPQRYYYRVTAYNSAAASPPSAVVSGVPYDVPTAPRSPRSTATNLSGQIRLTWVAPLSTGGSPITDYAIERSPNGTSGWVTLNDGINANTTYTVTGLPNGVRQYFRVVAKNALGNSPSSSVVHAVPVTLPSAPRSLTATATGVSGQVRLAWLAPQSAGGSPITDYAIERSPNGTSNWTRVNDGVNVARAFTVTGLSNGVRYYFRVVARNAVGYGPASNVRSVVPASFLTAPRSLTAVPTNRSGQVRLAWLAPLSNGGAAITDYIVQRSPSGTAGWTTIIDGVNVSTAYTVTGLSNGVRYHFRVVARNARGNGPPSSIVNAIPRTVPTAPRSLAAVPTNGSGQVRLTWLAPASNGGSAITDYLIQRSTNGTTWAPISDGVGTSTTLLVNGLTNGVRYYFRVYARNAAGWSPVSAVMSAIPRTVPGTPAYVRVAAFDWGFRLDWGDPVSTGGLPVTGFLIQVFDPVAGVWFDFFTARPTTRILEINAPGEGCGAFRIATLNAVGRSAFLGPVIDCWP